MSDAFELRCEVEDWAGSFSFQGQNAQFKLRIFVDESGVFGLGKDSDGTFIIKGRYDRNTHQMSFIKNYLGKFQLEFVGQIHNDGKYYFITGNWRNSQGQSGSFEIYKPMPGQSDRMYNFYQAPPAPQNFQPVFFGLPVN